MRTLPRAPGAPVVQVEASNSTLQVNWREPDDTGSFSISTYTVYWRATAGSASTSTELSGDSRMYPIDRINEWSGLLG